MSGLRVHGVAHGWGTFFLGRLATYFSVEAEECGFLGGGCRPPGEMMDLDAANAMTRKAVGYEVCGYWRVFEREEAGWDC